MLRIKIKNKKVNEQTGTEDASAISEPLPTSSEERTERDIRIQDLTREIETLNTQWKTVKNQVILFPKQIDKKKEELQDLQKQK